MSLLLLCPPPMAPPRPFSPPAACPTAQCTSFRGGGRTMVVRGPKPLLRWGRRSEPRPRSLT